MPTTRPADSTVLAFLQSKKLPVVAVKSSGEDWLVKFATHSAHPAAMRSSIATSFALAELVEKPTLRFEWSPNLGPLKVGVEVQVVGQDDEIADSRFLGMRGLIKRIQRGSAGVGDSRSDPFFIVDVDGAEDGFWGSELVRVS